MSDELTRLRAAAEGIGVQTGYWDVHGAWHDASVEALVAVVGAVTGTSASSVEEATAGAHSATADRRTALVEPTVVAWSGQDAQLVVRLAPTVTTVALTLEPDVRSGLAATGVDVDLHAGALAVGQRHGRREWRIDLAVLALAAGTDHLPVGRHRLTVVAAGDSATTVVLVAPRRVASLGPDARLWGVFAPLWSLWSDARPEPHLGHLARLAEAIDGQGGKVVATLPMLATFLDRPYEPSPYAPVSRRWWNELYLDLSARPELRDCPEARVVLERAPVPPDPAAPFDARARYATVREAVGLLAAHVARDGGALGDDLAAFASTEGVLPYARFRAAVERTGTGWSSWPGDGLATVDDVAPDDPAVQAHVYAQWAMRRQLGRLGEGLERRGQRLYLDLPVGTHRDGWDTFAHRALFAVGASVGAPPDEFFSGGQDWGFPPMLPEASRADGHAHLAECLRAHMAVAGMLRIDHVMQLHRLFWVPPGASPADGAYVGYPSDELVAVLAIESHLADCAVVGEDLGTVPDEVRALMQDHGVAGMFVAEFEQPAWSGAPLGAPAAGAVASVDTHDTPPFAAWVRGEDIDRRWSSGLIDVVGADRERVERRQQVAELVRQVEERGLLGGRGEAPAASGEATVVLHTGLLRRLGDSDAACVLVALDDLVGATEPQNVPGTSSDRPNWVQRLPLPLAEVLDEPAVVEALARLQDHRLGAWSRREG